MRNKIALLLAVLMLASALLCGCGEEKTLEPWTMPAVDAKPTVEPTPVPTYGGGNPEEYIWNEAESFNMSDPGAAPESVQETLSHNDCLALFPYNFLPTALFTESYSAYQRLNRQKTNHDVLRDPNDGGLAEHSYVEFVYLPSGRDETRGLTVMAELCSYDAVSDMYFQRIYPHISYPEQAKPQLLRPIRGAVDFEHVRFSYPDSPDKIIIKDFSAHVAPGQKVAIVGPTGAGKTTMVNLLMRFYELTDGCIKIDGVPTTDIQREDVQRLFGMVLQDTWLFEGTVRENLVYNLPGVTDAQLETVCRACGLDKFVHSLPEGFDTVLSESTSISAGQKQLLTIARAMLQDAPMLILDEATSSVDTRTELLIQRAMDQLTENRTSFVIAHRLSTIKNANLILVMKDGDVIESGTHDTLMQQGGFYAALYNSQFEHAEESA